jgi:hypothetical protein
MRTALVVVAILIVLPLGGSGQTIPVSTGSGPGSAWTESGAEIHDPIWRARGGLRSPVGTTSIGNDAIDESRITSAIDDVTIWTGQERVLSKQRTACAEDRTRAARNARCSWLLNLPSERARMGHLPVAGS